MLDVPPPHATHMAVRPRTDAPPVVAPPVTKIVATAGRRTSRPVADLVGRMAGGVKPLVRNQVLISKIILIRRRELAAPDPSRQPGAFFNNQCIGADVLCRRC